MQKLGTNASSSAAGLSWPAINAGPMECADVVRGLVMLSNNTFPSGCLSSVPTATSGIKAMPVYYIQ